MASESELAKDAETAPASVLEIIALGMIRLAALPVVLGALLLWGLIMGALVALREVQTLTVLTFRLLTRPHGGWIRPIGPQDA